MQIKAQLNHNFDNQHDLVALRKAAAFELFNFSIFCVLRPVPLICKFDAYNRCMFEPADCQAINGFSHENKSPESSQKQLACKLIVITA